MRHTTATVSMGMRVEVEVYRGDDDICSVGVVPESCLVTKRGKVVDLFGTDMHVRFDDGDEQLLTMTRQRAFPVKSWKILESE